jgi:hypothetical protein
MDAELHRLVVDEQRRLVGMLALADQFLGFGQLLHDRHHALADLVELGHDGQKFSESQVQLLDETGVERNIRAERPPRLGADVQVGSKDVVEAQLERVTKRACAE